jgi:5-formyltetrahydrofolate cyclo-ligase
MGIIMKASLRSEMIRKRDALSQVEIHNKSSKILERLLRTKEYKRAEEVFTFVSFGSEVDTNNLILNALKSNKKVYTPKIIDKGIIEFYEIRSFQDLAPSKFEILEPTTDRRGKIKGSEGNQLMIIPGVAFDTQGNRMGYGGGYYDRYFAKNYDCQVLRFALCYELQILGRVPTEEYDQKVDKIITEKREINRYE